ncbi:MAG: ATP-binding protein [Polyangiaceae bacterium]|nr:ATP-binding protein [Polyangiaceae bacterium]
MSALALARELALLGAHAIVAEKDHDALDPAAGFAHGADKFRELGVRMAAHVDARPSSVERLCGRLGLSPIGYWLVTLAAAGELNPEVAAALSLLAEDERVHVLTPISFARLVRSALGVPFAAALDEAAPGGPAERLGLIERADQGSGRPLTHVPLRLTPAEMRIQLLDRIPMLEVTRLAVGREAPSHVLGLPDSVVRGAAAILAEEKVLCIRADAARIARQLALDIASVRGETALVVRGADEPPDASDVVKLRGGLVVLDLFAASQARGFPDAYVTSLRADPHAPTFIALGPRNAATQHIATVDASDLDLSGRARLFATVVGPGDAAADLAQRFRVSLDEIRSAARAARTKKRLADASFNSDAPLTSNELAAEILAQGARTMGRLVTHLPARARFDDLVVPSVVRDQLRDLASYHRVTSRVKAGWEAFDRQVLGRGLSCLFSGSPGTGKTFAAQCIANDLGLNLYRIDLSQVVSKYIGETEKSLSRVFEEAEAGHGVLLFDEADALFGKRSEVKDAHDRYANVEVAYLLQRMESFDGISILTTNLASNIDTAFLRRLKFVIEFPMPDASMRAELWEKSLLPKTQRDRDLDLTDFIERFPISGGNIRNIGVASAHLAVASPRGLLSTEHVVRATYRELEKVGLARSRDDFGPLARHLGKGSG